MSDPNHVYLAIISYTERTELVRQAITDLQPGLFSYFNANGTPLDEALDVSPQLKKLPPGVWRDSQGVEWEYFFHGIGCRLTDPVTGEVIDWDLAERYVVDKFFFIRWLNSLGSMRHGEPDEVRKQKVERGISAAFDQLVSEGRLMCLNEVSRNLYKMMDLEYHL